MPSGGFDNLSALPLRRQAHERTLAASLSRTNRAQDDDQWAHLSTLRLLRAQIKQLRLPQLCTFFAWSALIWYPDLSCDDTERLIAR